MAFRHHIQDRGKAQTTLDKRTGSAGNLDEGSDGLENFKLVFGLDLTANTYNLRVRLTKGGEGETGRD